MPTYLNGIAKLETSFKVSHRFVMVAGDVAASHQISRLSRLPRLKTDNHGPNIGIVQANLHGQISHIGGAGYAGQTEQ